MTDLEEMEMHELAERLFLLTKGTGWEASRYAAIGHVMERLAEYCAVGSTPAARRGSSDGGGDD